MHRHRSSGIYTKKHPIFIVAKPANLEVEGRSGFQLESWTQCVSWTWRFGNDSVGPLKGRRATSETNMDTYNMDEDVKASSGNLLNYWVGLQLSLPFKTHFTFQKIGQASQVNSNLSINLDQWQYRFMFQKFNQPPTVDGRNPANHLGCMTPCK